MLVRFLHNKAFSPDHVRVVNARAGDVADVPDRLATRYLELGICTNLDGEATATDADEASGATTTQEAPPAAEKPPAAARGGRTRRGKPQAAGGRGT